MVKKTQILRTLTSTYMVGIRRFLRMGLFDEEIVHKDNHEIEDRLRLKRACEGCKQSLSILYQKYRKPVCDFLHKAGADDSAEDICQSVFMNIYHKKCKYDGSRDVKNYIFGIAQKLFKQDIKLENINAYGIVRVLAQGEKLIRKSVQECPDNTLESIETRQALQAKIAQLPPHAQQAVKLVFLDTIPAKEAAKIAKCDFKAFRKRLRYGLKILKKERSLKSLLNNCL